MIVGVGIDVAEIERFGAALERTPNLARRLFLDAELTLPSGERRGTASLAARFAAKEASRAARGRDVLCFGDSRVKFGILPRVVRDQSGKKWDEAGEAGLRFVKGPVNVEYFRDVQPILRRSCTACHTAAGGKEPAGNLNLDADGNIESIIDAGGILEAYYLLAEAEGHPRPNVLVD